MADLAKKFNFDDMGDMHWYLGLKVTRSDNQITLDSAKYIRDKLSEFGMANCNPSPVPYSMQPGQADTQERPLDKDEHSLYRSMVGALIWVSSTTRPDIAFITGTLSQTLQNPTAGHLTQAKKVWRYLKATVDEKLTYTKNGFNDFTYTTQDMKLAGYSDADWASSKTDRKSTTGYVFRVAGAATSWKSKKQPTVALSTYEAEYMAEAACVQHALYLNSLLEELKIIKVFMPFHGKPLVIHGDNQAALKCAQEAAQ